jgi:hypothetical protein
MVLSPRSNREDFIVPVGIFDEVTNEPIKVDGCVTANGLPFTGSNWNVTSGSVITTSTTALTIPVFPIYSASQLALLLFVQTNLALVPGNPVTIADPTGQNTMNGIVTGYSTSTGSLVVQIGYAFEFEIRRGGPRGGGLSDGYSAYFAIVTAPDDCGPLIKATLGNGIAIVDIGAVQIVIPASGIQRLTAGTYSVGMILSDGCAVRQVFDGTVPIISGGVSRTALQVVSGPLWN